jgi:hypothetical protein
LELWYPNRILQYTYTYAYIYDIYIHIWYIYTYSHSIGCFDWWRIAILQQKNSPAFPVRSRAAPVGLRTWQLQGRETIRVSS